MAFSYPPEASWWDALCFRLSGTENVPVRCLIAGNPNLPREGFLALLRDKDADVLEALSKNPALPTDLAIQLLSHDSLFLSLEWTDNLTTRPDLSPDDLSLIMDEGSYEGMRQALMHPNADEDVLESYFLLGGRVDEPRLAASLLKRFPWGQYPKVWLRIKEDLQWSRALLRCPETPQSFLVWLCWEQRKTATFGGRWEYLHEISEEICRHPQADAEVFDILMDDGVFEAMEYERDYPCSRSISEHPKASERQRRDALTQIQSGMDEEE